ncbi:MAG TPA: hypothetical protein VIF09_29490 [Polyangiaceae bacterium]
MRYRPGGSARELAVLASLATHVVAAGVLLLSRPHVRAEVVDSAALDVDVLALDPELPGPSPSDPGLVAATTAPGPTNRSTPPAERGRSAVPEGPREPLAPSPAQPADSGAPWSLSPAASLDLGIGSYWKVVATRDTPLPAPSVEPGPPAGPSPARILRDGLDAHDRALGLGRAGPLVSAAHEASSPSVAPDVGAATLDVESDATGKVLSARVVSGSPDASAWTGVARELVRLMASRSVRVPADARGLRTRLRIVAERTSPSGGGYATSAGGVPDDACVGRADPRLGGLGRKCLTGMPTGGKQTLDLSDVGAKPSRVVHVQVLSESVL